MAFQNEVPFDLKKLQEEFGISQRRIQSCGLSEGELRKIYDDYTRNIPQFQKDRAYILTTLNEELGDKVHSVRGRVKAPSHLIEKIIRNRIDKPEKYKLLNIDNYNKIITDLLGFRIIILEKTEWRDVHTSLLSIFRNIPERYAVNVGDIVKNYDLYADESKKPKQCLDNSYHAEKPVAYLTSIDDRSLYKGPHLTVDESKLHYRSIHYVIRYRDLYFEIQVRTLFEEGWLEFDHRIKYPYDQNNGRKREFLSILNSIVTAGDRLVTFYNSNLSQSDFEEKPDYEDATGAKEADEVDDTKKQSFRDRLLANFDGR